MTEQPRPTPQLRKALSELLEQKIPLPESEAQQYKYERDVKPGEDAVYRLGSAFSAGDEETLTFPRIPNILWRNTHLKGNITIRQFLNAYMHSRFHDPFVREETRKTHLDEPQYQAFLLNNTSLNQYLRFLLTVIEIVDHNRFPDNVAPDQVNNILRDGIVFISGTKDSKRGMMQDLMNINKQPDLRNHAMREVADDMLRGNYPKSIDSEKLPSIKKEVERIIQSVKALLDDQIKGLLNPQDIKGMEPDDDTGGGVAEPGESSQNMMNYFRRQIMQDRIVSYLLEHELDLPDQTHQAAIRQNTEWAEECEDSNACYADIAARLRKALEKAGIRSRDGGDFPLGL